MIKIGVDANGGDFGVETTVPGAILALNKIDDLEIVFYGDEEKIKPLLKECDMKRISIVHTKVTMDMGEHDPVRAVRKMKDSSLDMVMYAAKNKEIDGVVTSGPTQCVVMAAHLIVRRLECMERVALCPIMTNYDGKPRLILDVGANVELKIEHLGQFAIFATVAAKEILGIENPTVGLLNIGSEPGKGREQEKLAYDYLANLNHINFYGNVEPNEIINCPTNIVVCDGFSGNIAVKTLEGTAKTMGVMLKDEIKSSLFGKIGYLFMRKNLARFKKRMSSDEVGGAMILGVSAPVVKAHGNSNAYAYSNAIYQVYNMVKKDLINKVLEKLPKEEGKENE